MKEIEIINYDLLQMLMELQKVYKGDFTDDYPLKYKPFLLELGLYSLTVYATTGHRLWKRRLFCNYVREPFNILISSYDIQQLIPILKQNKYNQTTLIVDDTIGCSIFKINGSTFTIHNDNQRFPLEVAKNLLKSAKDEIETKLIFEPNLLKSGLAKINTPIVCLSCDSTEALELTLVEYTDTESLPAVTRKLSILQNTVPLFCMLKPKDLLDILQNWKEKTIVCGITPKYVLIENIDKTIIYAFAQVFIKAS